MLRSPRYRNSFAITAGTASVVACPDFRIPLHGQAAPDGSIDLNWRRTNLSRIGACDDGDCSGHRHHCAFGRSAKTRSHQCGTVR